MIAIRGEHLMWDRDTNKWLKETYGESTLETWWFDVQPGIIDLVCTEEIAAMVLLKYGQG